VARESVGCPSRTSFTRCRPGSSSTAYTSCIHREAMLVWKGFTWQSRLPRGTIVLYVLVFCQLYVLVGTQQQQQPQLQQQQQPPPQQYQQQPSP
uniref:Uncharacterized protein n=1 Tax=Anopheles christyi TaxID=43041 RepID=A0A182KJ18_9DIPT